MSNIVIKDLPESIELDRQAMRAISGGKSGPLGTSPYRSSFFQNPLEFADLKLVPPIFEPDNTWLK